MGPDCGARSTMTYLPSTWAADLQLEFVQREWGSAARSFVKLAALFAFAALANTAGALLTRRMLGSYELVQVNRLAIAMTGIAALACFALIFVTPNLPVFWAAICLYVFAFGMILPTSNTVAMDPAGDMPGFAASLIGSVQGSLGAGGSAIAAIIFIGSHHTIPILMAGFGALTVATSFLKSKPQDS